jgi:hypothetical protein
MLLGLLVRLRYVIAAGGFPLGDGGLFAQMIRAIQQDGYHLPVRVVYNGERLPFAYPPFGFYAAALLAAVTHVGIYTVESLLPTLVNVATIGAVYLFARAFFTSRMTALAAACAFALMPLGFRFTIQGGGITRAFGLLFAVLTLWQLQRSFVAGGWRHAVGAGAFAALTTLSHPEFPLFIAEGALVLLLMQPCRRLCLLRGSLAGGVAAILVLPWLATVLARYGVASLVHSASTGNAGIAGLTYLSHFALTGEQLFPVIGALALAGVCACFLQRRALLIWWLIGACVIDWRGGKLYAPVLIALLAGIGVSEVLLPLLARAGRVRRAPLVGERPAHHPDARAATFGRRLALAALLVYSAVAATKLPASHLAALSADDRAAMAWVANNTSTTARFLVVGAESDRQDDEWGAAADRVAEWFPALAQRSSATTFEGTEWTGQFAARSDADAALLLCADRATACLDAWSRRYSLPFDAVYLPKGEGADVLGGEAGIPGGGWCCWSLRNALRNDANYKVIYDGPGATIAVRRVGA